MDAGPDLPLLRGVPEAMSALDRNFTVAKRMEDVGAGVNRRNKSAA